MVGGQTLSSGLEAVWFSFREFVVRFEQAWDLVAYNGPFANLQEMRYQIGEKAKSTIPLF